MSTQAEVPIEKGASKKHLEIMIKGYQQEIRDIQSDHAEEIASMNVSMR